MLTVKCDDRTLEFPCYFEVCSVYSDQLVPLHNIHMSELRHAQEYTSRGLAVPSVIATTSRATEWSKIN